MKKSPIMHKRIVILGDSLSMPRPDDGITYNDTYPYLLYTQGYEVHNRSKRTNDTSMQTRQQNLLDDIIFLDPDIIVVFLGIVDCAPRLFTKKEVMLLKKLPDFLRKSIIGFCSKHRYNITKFRQRTYVDLTTFQHNMEKIIQTAFKKNSQIILCTILQADEQTLARSFHFKENIDNYNNEIIKLSEKYKLPLINVNECQQGLLDDGIHINKKMHEFLFRHIYKALKS